MDQHLSYKPDWFEKENMDSYNEQTNDNMILCKNLEIVALEVGYYVTRGGVLRREPTPMVSDLLTKIIHVHNVNYFSLWSDWLVIYGV
jgi:hypothetical protein